MDARCILNPGTSAESLNQQITNTPPAAQRTRSFSHGGDLSWRKSPRRRSLRSSSARTASDTNIQKARTQTPRRPSMLLAPLFPRNVSVSPPRLRSGSVTSTLSTHTLGSEPQTRKRSPRKHHTNNNNNLRHTHLNHLESPARAQARFRASLILWYARQTIARSTAMTTGRLDRAPCVMDVVLNLKVEYDDDTLIELLQRYRYGVGSQLKHTKVVHAFKDQRSVNTYWADQAAVWGGMRTIEEGKSTRFPDSDERSTASWTAAPN